MRVCEDEVYVSVCPAWWSAGAPALHEAPDARVPDQREIISIRPRNK